MAPTCIATVCLTPASRADGALKNQRARFVVAVTSGVADECASNDNLVATRTKVAASKNRSAFSGTLTAV